MRRLLTLCALISSMSVFAQTSGDRIHTMKLNTTEQFGYGATELAPELHVNDIDSITFDVEAQTFTVYGQYDVLRHNPLSATYNLEKLQGFDFTYLSDGKLASPSLYFIEQTDLNSFRIGWRPVEGAAGYDIISMMSDNIEEELDNEQSSGFIVWTSETDETELSVSNQPYSSNLVIAIRALSSKEKYFNSDWSMRSNFKYGTLSYLTFTTSPRYTVPNLIKNVEFESNAMIVNLNMRYDRRSFPEEEIETIRKHLSIGTDGLFDITDVMVEDLTDGETKTYNVKYVSSEGRLRVPYTKFGHEYRITPRNTDLPSCDANYQSVTVCEPSSTALMTYVNSLDEKYSIFKSLVDGKLNSEVITPYSQSYVMMLPSDEVIEAAIADAHARLNRYGMEREDSVLYNWIRDVAFFGSDAAENFAKENSSATDAESSDVYSVISKQWRKDKQEIDAENYIDLEDNRRVYLVTKLHIPDNVLIYRLKDYFSKYEFCTTEQKDEFFKMENMKFSSIKTDVDGWSPFPDVWPLHENRVLNLGTGDDGADSPFALDYTLCRQNENGDMAEYKIPPGKYRLAFGSKQNQHINIRAKVIVDNQIIASSDEIILGSSIVYHYDRGYALSDCYPEGYDYKLLVGKASNYDTDGGLLIEEVTIPDVNGDGTPVSVRLRIEADNWNSQYKFTLHHWCLRPTANFY